MGLSEVIEVGLKQAAGKVICIAVTDTDVAR